MHILVRAVITGFGLALGAAIYKKIARELGLDDGGATATVPASTGEPAQSAT
jgi:hypothetical protein